MALSFQCPITRFSTYKCLPFLTCLKAKRVPDAVLQLIDCNRDLSANSWGRKYEGGASKQRGMKGRKADIAESEVDTKERNRHRLK